MIDITEARQHLAAMSPRPWTPSASEEINGGWVERYRKIMGAHLTYNFPLGTEEGDLAEADLNGICYFINHAQELLDELESLRVDRETFKEMGQFLIDVLARGCYYHELTECGLKDHRAFEAQPLDVVGRYYRMAGEQLAAKWPGVFS